MKLKDIFVLVTKSITPKSDEHYHLYSLPSFDENKTREEVKGKEIMSNKLVVPDKCILFNKLNVRFKRVWSIDNQDSNKLASTEFLPLVVREDKVDFKFAYYLLVSDLVTNYLSGQNSNTSGSHKRINPDVLLEININLPSRPKQEGIGRILSNIDAKIALNREINRNLEAMARQLYDYWFVQFDFPDENGRPYKSSGGKMVWNEKLRREIPEGWIISTIGNIASLNISSLSKKDDLRELLYLDTSSLTENKIDTVQHIERDDAPSRAQRKVSKNTILYSTVRPRLKHFGILCNPPDNLIASTGFCTIDANNISYSFWLYLFLTEEKIIKNLSDIADTAVSSYPSIGPSDIEGLQVCLGNDGLMALFYEKVSALFEIIESNQNENNELQKQRDELLPLLMNGQVSVMPLATNCDLPHD